MIRDEEFPWNDTIYDIALQKIYSNQFVHWKDENNRTINLERKCFIYRNITHSRLIVELYRFSNIF